MNMRASTKRSAKRLAKIFREAAMFIEEGDCFFACSAIRIIAKRDYLECPEVNAFKAVFDRMDDGSFVTGWFGPALNPIHQSERIVALCFAAAVIERP